MKTTHRNDSEENGDFIRRFRQRGFARCLYRLKDMGIHNAYITGYSEAALDLYGSIGAVDEVRPFVYERPE